MGIIWVVVKMMVPFLGTLNIRCRIVIGVQKRTKILATTHMGSYSLIPYSPPVSTGQVLRPREGDPKGGAVSEVSWDGRCALEMHHRCFGDALVAVLGGETKNSLRKRACNVLPSVPPLRS